MAHVAEKVTMKIVTVLVGIPVGVATKKIVERAWDTARSADTPRTPSERGVRWGDAIGWAALSAAGVVAADLLTRKGAEKVWRTVIGTEPPPRRRTKVEKKFEKAQERAKLSC
jgi:Protein of unknown function (DUF4235)